MQNSRKNKQNMCRNLKNLLTSNEEKKSLIYVNPDMIRKCITDKCLKDISSRYNHAYQVLIGDKLINIVFLEVLPDYYKLITGGAVWEVLRNFEWRYYQGEVCTIMQLGETRNPKFKIERAICNLMKGSETFKCDNYQIHHKWFRAVALKETVTLLPGRTHKMWHSVVGHYARNQVINIIGEKDFYQFIGELIKVRKIMSDRIFGLEF